MGRLQFALFALFAAALAVIPFRAEGGLDGYLTKDGLFTARLEIHDVRENGGKVTRDYFYIVEPNGKWSRGKIQNENVTEEIRSGTLSKDELAKLAKLLANYDILNLKPAAQPEYFKQIIKVKFGTAAGHLVSVDFLDNVWNLLAPPVSNLENYLTKDGKLVGTLEVFEGEFQERAKKGKPQRDTASIIIEADGKWTVKSTPGTFPPEGAGKLTKEQIIDLATTLARSDLINLKVTSKNNEYMVVIKFAGKTTKFGSGLPVHDPKEENPTPGGRISTIVIKVRELIATSIESSVFEFRPGFRDNLAATLEVRVIQEQSGKFTGTNYVVRSDGKWSTALVHGENVIEEKKTGMLSKREMAKLGMALEKLGVVQLKTTGEPQANQTRVLVRFGGMYATLNLQPGRAWPKLDINAEVLSMDQRFAGVVNAVSELIRAQPENKK